MSQAKLPEYAAQAKKRVDAFRASLEEESDRGLVLVGGAFLEEELKELLRVYFALQRRLLNPASQSAQELENTVKSLFSFQGGGPLSTFAGKSNLAYALGLLEKYEFRSLGSFSKLRNKFAHNIESNTLQSPQVVDLVKNFLDSKKVERDAVADRVAKLAYQLIARTVILSQDDLPAETTLQLLGFARGDPYGLSQKT
ncbi:MltR family transcriptional regulator [Truepera radiovictrix]|uniref:Mannitol repressor protein n=1 Tax=Truepera radiovictrix (strain DSM 17093 / CIP 108686 / LMG 22925 / RQ-24) TaxID=649638 RepID=D7CY31_TRURR|nr:MltR family transcriptional regulator [Truepera radiovictrix]ADI13391.1 hypothetical protein Trad_0251 [Truepera radiovictrix DSM 17093]WMT58046.1 MltR family transcriptional regulator [Truepera radiovictrix]